MLKKQTEKLTLVDHVVKFQYEDAKKLRLVIFFQLAAIAALVFLIITDWSNKPSPIGFKINSDNQLIQPMPLNQAGISNAAMLNWFTEGVMSAYSFNYKNKDEKLKKIKNYFTPNGYNKFMKSIQDNVLFSGIENEKLILSMRILQAPEILQDGVINNRYAWNIKLPIIVYLQNQLVRRAVRLDIETLIVRVPEIVSPMGILIDDYVALEFGASSPPPAAAGGL